MYSSYPPGGSAGTCSVARSYESPRWYSMYELRPATCDMRGVAAGPRKRPGDPVTVLSRHATAGPARIKRQFHIGCTNYPSGPGSSQPIWNRRAAPQAMIFFHPAGSVSSRQFAMRYNPGEGISARFSGTKLNHLTAWSNHGWI